MIDLRSDTVTRPSAGMRRVMAEAEVGDDVYAEDPTVLELQERVAAMFGHEAALFTPTGSMANVLAVAAVVGPGEEVICESRAHILRAELVAFSDRFPPDAGRELAIVAPPVEPDLMCLVQRADEQTNPDRQQLDFGQRYLDVTRNHQPLVEHAIEHIDKTRGTMGRRRKVDGHAEGDYNSTEQTAGNSVVVNDFQG